MPASTLRRVLEYQPNTGTFLRNADYPLATSLLVIDEASMIDLVLFDHVLQALPLGAGLVLIGDVDQRPVSDQDKCWPILLPQAWHGRYDSRSSTGVATRVGSR